MSMSELEQILKDHALGVKRSKSSQNSSTAASTMNEDSELEREDEDEDEKDEDERFADYVSRHYDLEANEEKKDEAGIEEEDDEITFLGSRPVEKKKKNISSPFRNVVDLTEENEPVETRVKRESSADTDGMSDSTDSSTHGSSEIEDSDED
ncbi:hypothetical protein PC116_g33280 [Phytophthora cactorum]|nr:hypothetical protein PC116_g33280 [Phytophthora cactorum]